MARVIRQAPTTRLVEERVVERQPRSGMGTVLLIAALIIIALILGWYFLGWGTTKNTHNNPAPKTQTQQNQQPSRSAPANQTPASGTKY